MTIEDDEQLLNSLGAMFAAELVHHPSDAERDAFLNVVAEQPATDERDDDTVVVPFERPTRRWGRRVAVGGASVVVAISGLTAVAAAANNGVLPTPARVVAHAVGLPVDSVELAKAKDALRQLRGADDASLTRAFDRVEHALSGLSGDELRKVTHELEDARSRRGRGGGGSSGRGGNDGSSDTSIATQSPTGSVAPTSDDRGGGSSGRGGSDDGSSNASSDDGTHGGSSPSIADKSGSGSGSGNDSGSGSDSGGSGSRGSGGSSGGGGSDDGVAATTPSATVSGSAPVTDDSHRDDGTTVTTETSHSTTATTASTGGTTATTDDHGGGSGGGSGSGGSGKKP